MAEQRDLAMLASQDTEITLGTGKLLGIFFSLVIVCGLFFGLGFNFGRATASQGEPTLQAIPPTLTVAGGTLQLPVVGGGSQLATIGMLRGVFNLSPELSISCGIMLWLVTFMSVTPAGLALARSEHVSLMKIEKESLEEEEKALKEAGDLEIGPSEDRENQSH